MPQSPYRKTKINGRTVQEHRAVWERHNGPVPDGMVVHHINGNKRDNRLENLELMTHREHSIHHNQKHPTTKPCGLCGTVYEPNPTKRARSVTCSRECFRELMRRERRSRNPAIKVEGEKRLELHRRAVAGEPRALLAEQYGVHVNTVSRIKNDPLLAEAVLRQVIA